METIVELSSGGVLIDSTGDEPLLCLIQVQTRGGNPSWRLPKGWIEPDETPEEAAIRETREETGCTGTIISQLSPVEYWYTRRHRLTNQRLRVHKHVDFFLMHYVSGDVADHDDEVDEARWFTFPKAVEAISYDSERRLVHEAIHAWNAYVYLQS